MEDPVKRGLSDGREDLYDVATWEVRSLLDRVAVGVFRRMGHPLAAVARWLSGNSPRIDLSTHGSTLVNVAVVWLVVQFWLVLFAFVRNFPVGLASALSVVPVVALLAYVRGTDRQLREPRSLLALTFLVGVILGFVAFGANVALVPVFKLLLGVTISLVTAVAGSVVDPAAIETSFDVVATVALALSLYLVIGPVEEALKWLAVRTYAYGSDPFDTVVDGVVYGAVAGFGFATVESTIYISFQAMGGVAIVEPLGATAWGTILFTRAFLGPGNVVFAAFAGYYLGLAKFNPESVGPIVVKGLLIAVLLHGTYSLLGTYLITPDIQMANLLYVGYIVVFNGIVGYLLYRKVARYRAAYRRAPGAGSGGTAAGN